VSGLARVLRANAQVGLQDVALWHERDISHSSAERIVLPDSASLALYATRRMTRLVRSLEINVDRMRANLDASRGLVFSQSVLLCLVEQGMLRDDAYRIVQAASRTAHDEGRHLRDVIAATGAVTDEVLDVAFDESRVLRHSSRGIDALRAAIV
jgi:adenylosuccinate lyase